MPLITQGRLRMARKFLVKRPTAIAASLALVVGAAVAGGYLHYLGFEPAADRYPLVGIDISHHQGDIDWDLLATDRVAFVYMKATEGGDFKDTRFDQNWQAAARVGIPRGAYHFFTLCRPGDEQARNFLATVPSAENILPPAVDLEFTGNCAARPPKADVLRELVRFLSLLEARYKSKPVLYLTQPFHEVYLDGELLEYPLWARRLYFEPRYRQDWEIWQFHDRSSRKGIVGPVDLNVFRGDEDRLRQFLVSDAE